MMEKEKEGRKTTRMDAVCEMQASAKACKPHCQLHLGEAIRANSCLDPRLPWANLEEDLTNFTLKAELKTNVKLNPPFGTPVTLKSVPHRASHRSTGEDGATDDLVPLSLTNGGEEACPCFYGDSQVSKGYSGTSKTAGAWHAPEATIFLNG